MKLKLKRTPRMGSALLLKTSQGMIKFSKVGDEVEVADADGHSLAGKYPDMIEIVTAPAPKAKKEKAAAAPENKAASAPENK